MKQFLMITMFLVFIGIIVGANIYLAKRFATFFSTGITWPLYILFPLITIFMMFGMFTTMNSVSGFGHSVNIAASVTVGFVLYLLIATIAVDLFGLAVKIKPLYSGIAAISLALLISIYGLWNAANVRINEVDIKIPGLVKPVKAVHLTDTHIGHMRDAGDMQKIVDMINDQNPDVVFFTGDLLDSKYQLNSQSLDPLGKFNAPIYFVEGNHDEYTGVDAIKDYLRKIGVNVLENEVRNWKQLQIVGLTYMNADENTTGPHTDPNGKNVKGILKELSIDTNKPSVLLHHGPAGVKYANDAGVDLYLAGHTHGGQIWPITHIAGLMFEYNKGLHDHNGTHVYISQGTGTFGPPMRVGTYSELTVLNLLPDSL